MRPTSLSLLLRAQKIKNVLPKLLKFDAKVKIFGKFGAFFAPDFALFVKLISHVALVNHNQQRFYLL